MSTERMGTIYGLLSNLLWGAFPIYWSLMEPASTIEVLAFRIVGSLIFVVVTVAALRRIGDLRTLTRDVGRVGTLVLAGAMITVNWGIYIWAAGSGHVVETSLGAFIAPLITMLIGVVLLGERLRRPQLVAVAIAAAAVVVLTVGYGRPPWIALLTASIFSFYGFCKKRARAGAWEGMVVETSLLAPAAMGIIVWLHSEDRGTFLSEGAAHALILGTVGVGAAAPLLLFAAAATRVSMTTLGLVQYVAPTVQLCVGAWYFHENVSSLRLTGFTLVWIALAIFTGDALRRQRSRIGTPEGAPAT